jgi:hypothetical protein
MTIELRRAALAAVLVLSIPALAEDSSRLDLVFRADPVNGGIFTVRGRVDAPRGALVLVGLSFDGQVVRGTWRRVEVGPEGALEMLWPVRARVLPGEYEAVATLDSSRQPRALRKAMPGPARSIHIHAFVGDPEADVAEEEVVRHALLADAALVTSLTRECMDAAPLTSTSPPAGRSERRAFLSRSDALLDQLERRLESIMPPAVFAARLPDLEEMLLTTVQSFRKALLVEAWQDMDQGMDAPDFVDRDKRPQPPFVTLREVSIESARVNAELDFSRAGTARGPRSLEKLVRQATALSGLLEHRERDPDEDGARATSARRARAVTLARELARDPCASSIAGGADALKGIASALEALAAAPEEKRREAKRALDAALAPVAARVADERARRRAEVDEIARSLQQRSDELKTLARDRRGEWERSVGELHAAIGALPDRSTEFFVGVRAQLDLAARALIARETADAAKARYLENVLVEAVKRVKTALSAT